MRRNKGYFKKGFYNYAQVAGFPTVKQFIVTENKGKRCLLLRFANETNLTISNICFTLTQYDASGKVIEKSKVKYDKIEFRPETNYSHSKGIVISNECTDFKVDVNYVICGRYKYVNSNNHTVATYDIRGYDTVPFKGAGRSAVEIKKVKIGGSRALAFAATLSLILVLACCVFVVTHKKSSSGSGYDIVAYQSFSTESETTL